MVIRWKITKRSVDALEPGPKPFTKFDADIAGFGVEVRPSGLKVYVLLYRPAPGGRGVAKRRHVIGHHGEITPDQARRLALDARASIRLGEDPSGEKARRRAALRVDELCDAFLSDNAAKLKPKSLIAYAGGLEKVRAVRGSTLAEALARSDVAALHASLSVSPYAANRMLAAVSTVYGWAERSGRLPQGHPNPARGIRRFPERGREMVLSGDGLARIGDALAQGERVGLPNDIDETKPGSKHAPKADNRLVWLDPFAAAAIRMLAVTGMRLREVLHAKWSELDLERGVLSLADSKTGKKMVVLGSAALAVIAALPRLEGSPYLFPGAIPGKPRHDLRKPWATVSKAAGLPDLRIHDLRHHYASTATSAGLGLIVVGRLLGHASLATTQKYAHLDADPLRRAVETIGATIDGAMNRSSGNVVVKIR